MALELSDYELNGQRSCLQAVSLYAKQLDDANGNEAFMKIKSFLETSYGTAGLIALKCSFIISWSLPSTTITLYSNATDNMAIVYVQRSDREKR